MKSIQIKWVYSPKEANEVRVLVDKTSPYGRELHDLNIDYWCPQVSPSLGLLRQLQKEELSLNEFKNYYRQEIHSQPEKLIEPVEAAQKGSLTLVTANREPEMFWLETLKGVLEQRLATTTN